jgi:hypothetical protein
MNDMSERGKVFFSMWFLQVRISCLKCPSLIDGDSGHDISFTLTNGVYTLGELFGEIGILELSTQSRH